MQRVVSMIGLAIVGALFLVGTQGCSSATTAAAAKAATTLPAITPPMKKALPPAFGGTSTRSARTYSNLVFGLGELPGRASRTALPVATFNSRFFSAGPTDVLTILPNIDKTIASINTQTAKSTQACVTQDPVAYTFTAPDGTTVNMKGQCYEVNQTDQFTQWAIDSDNVFYLMSGGKRSALVASLAAIATPVSGSTTDYTVHVWFSVGNNNATADASWDAGSYTVAELIGNSATGKFEMTAAGMGIGFAGAQFKSDGTTIFGVGSEDMASSTSTQETVCVTAADFTVTAPTCTVSATDFTLTPIGRKSGTGVAQTTWAASHYPTVPNLTLDGTATDATNFALITPTTGVNQFTLDSAIAD